MASTTDLDRKRRAADSPGPEHLAVVNGLSLVAQQVDGLCRAALASGDFVLVTRYVGASQAVHLALLSLDEDTGQSLP